MISSMIECIYYWPMNRLFLCLHNLDEGSRELGKAPMKYLSSAQASSKRKEERRRGRDQMEERVRNQSGISQNVDDQANSQFEMIFNLLSLVLVWSLSATVVSSQHDGEHLRDYTPNLVWTLPTIRCATTFATKWLQQHFSLWEAGWSLDWTYHTQSKWSKRC